MRRLDRLHLEHPFAGSVARSIDWRGLQDRPSSREDADEADGIEALYRRPRTTKPVLGHTIYSYLLRGMEITRPNNVWAMDITYILMARGFIYLAVVLDWASRRVLAWRVSITIEAAFWV